MREVSYFSRVAGRVEGPILRPPRQLFGSLPAVEKPAASEGRRRKPAERPANAREKVERAGEETEPRPEAPAQGKIAAPRTSSPMLFKKKGAPAEIQPFTPGLDAAPQTGHVRPNPGLESATRASRIVHAAEPAEPVDRMPAMATDRGPGPVRTDPPKGEAGTYAMRVPARREVVDAKRDFDAGESTNSVFSLPRMPTARMHIEPAEAHGRTRPESPAPPPGAGDERVHIGSLEIRIVPAQPPPPQAQPAQPVRGKVKAASQPLSRSFPTYGLAQAY
jgi:hypothetical protein